MGIVGAYSIQNQLVTI